MHALIDIDVYYVFFSANATAATSAALTALGQLSNVNNEESSSDENSKTINLPKIVGIGLQGVFEIIRESQNQFPSICRRALESLSDILGKINYR